MKYVIDHLKKYLLLSIGLAVGNFVPGYYLATNASAAGTANLLWQSTGVFIVTILTCIRYGERHSGSCIFAAIFFGPFVGIALALLFRWLLH